jgi:hypothetical protein
MMRFIQCFLVWGGRNFVDSTRAVAILFMFSLCLMFSIKKKMRARGEESELDDKKKLIAHSQNNFFSHCKTNINTSWMERMRVIVRAKKRFCAIESLWRFSASFTNASKSRSHKGCCFSPVKIIDSRVTRLKSDFFL